MTVTLESVIVCPHCGHAACETMPADACQYFYDCRGCVSAAPTPPVR